MAEHDDWTAAGRRPCSARPDHPARRRRGHAARPTSGSSGPGVGASSPAVSRLDRRRPRPRSWPGRSGGRAAQLGRTDGGPPALPATRTTPATSPTDALLPRRAAAPAAGRGVGDQPSTCRPARSTRSRRRPTRAGSSAADALGQAHPAAVASSRPTRPMSGAAPPTGQAGGDKAVAHRARAVRSPTCQAGPGLHRDDRGRPAPVLALLLRHARTPAPDGSPSSRAARAWPSCSSSTPRSTT